jgi:hypothetical protein
MRASLVVFLLAACAGSSSNSVRRSLVTDDLHPGEARAVVTAWHDAHQWCKGDTSDTIDEFRACHVAMYTAPPVESVVEYKDGRVDALAVLVPVPCRITGFCDHVRQGDNPIHEAAGSLLHRIEDVGVRQTADTELETVFEDDIPSMHQRTLDAMEVELDHRYGAPTWANAKRSAMTWAPADGEHIALFLDERGGWVVETHLFGAP